MDEHLVTLKMLNGDQRQVFNLTTAFSGIQTIFFILNSFNPLLDARVPCKIELALKVGNVFLILTYAVIPVLSFIYFAVKWSDINDSFIEVWILACLLNYAL